VPERGSPNLARRRRLAAELRRLRERAGLTGDEATTSLGWPSSSKLSRIELGKTGLKPADLQSLLDLYNVTSARRAELTALAEESRKSGAIPAATARIPEEQIAFLEAEAEAASIRIWEPQVVPGLFQEEGYIRALFTAWATRFALRSADVNSRVETRRLRQELLTSDSPPEVSAVIDESVLRRRFGAPSVMREQLEHLAAISDLPNVQIRILPLDGEHMITTGGFNYLSFRQIHDVPLDDMVIFDHLTGIDDVEAEGDIHQYHVVFEALTASALDPEKSRALITGVAEEVWGNVPQPGAR
jgi:transcriptional regulator with XRE-family HTH domain